MGVVSRGQRLAAALALGAFTAGCGGSVADADAPSPRTTAPPPASQFCVAVQANSDAIRPLNRLGSGAPPEELSNTVDSVRRAGVDLVSAAPDSLRADVQRTVDAVDLQLDALVATGGDAAAAARDTELAARLRAPELTAASQRVSAYVNQTCGSRR